MPFFRYIHFRPCIQLRQHAQEKQALVKLGFSASIAQKAKMPYPYKAGWNNMEHETPDELDNGPEVFEIVSVPPVYLNYI
jgi:hypothetical protein